MEEVRALLAQIVGADDVAAMIIERLAGDTIRVAAIRYLSFRHRRLERWQAIKPLLMRTPRLWLKLERFALVRKEWRDEPESWSSGLQGGHVVRVILEEAAQGYWGARLPDI